MNHTPHSPESSATPWWQAFRYLHDEMTPEERQAFEDGLATDKSLREALVEIVALTDALSAESIESAHVSVAADAQSSRRASRPTSRPRAVERWRPQRAWWAAAAAVGIVLMGGWWLTRPDDSQGPQDVALAWAEQIEVESPLLTAELEWQWRDLETDPGAESEPDGFAIADAATEGWTEGWGESWVFSAALENDDWDWSWDGSGAR